MSSKEPQKGEGSVIVSFKKKYNEKFIEIVFIKLMTTEQKRMQNVSLSNLSQAQFYVLLVKEC